MRYMGYERLTRELAEQYLDIVYVYDDGKVEMVWCNS